MCNQIELQQSINYSFNTIRKKNYTNHHNSTTLFNALYIFKFEIGITTCYTKSFFNSTLKSIYSSQSLYTKRYLESSCFRSSTETIVPLVAGEGSSNNTNLKGKKKAYIENKMIRNTKHKERKHTFSRFVA